MTYLSFWKLLHMVEHAPDKACMDIHIMSYCHITLAHTPASPFEEDNKPHRLTSLELTGQAEQSSEETSSASTCRCFVFLFLC